MASSAVSIPVIQYSIPYLEGSHDLHMMSEVIPRFEPLERCCMAILFVGGRGKTAPHPTIGFSLLVEWGKIYDFHPKGVIPCLFFGTFLGLIERTLGYSTINLWLVDNIKLGILSHNDTRNSFS